MMNPRKNSYSIYALLIITLVLLLLSSNAIAVPKESTDKRFSDHDDGTITDTKTGLMWMKKDSYLHLEHWLNWHEVHDYIRQLNDEGFAQYNDWRLPTTDELKTLYEPDKLNSSQRGREMKIHIDPIFAKKGSGSIWSGDENGRYNALGVVFNTNSIFNSNKSSKSRKATRAVRVDPNKYPH
jgi:hypothetical protein